MAYKVHQAHKRPEVEGRGYEWSGHQSDYIEEWRPHSSKASIAKTDPTTPPCATTIPEAAPLDVSAAALCVLLAVPIPLAPEVRVISVTLAAVVSLIPPEALIGPVSIAPPPLNFSTPPVTVTAKVSASS